jgi:dipeptidyl aminopeptidase/acylaminoacyl peptidase
MWNRMLTTALIALASTLSAAADDAKSLREEMYRRYLGVPSLIRGGSIEPHWLPDGSRFWYAEGMPDRTVIYRIDPVVNSKQPLFDSGRVRQALTPLLGHEPPYQGLPFAELTFADGGESVLFCVAGRRFLMRLADYAISPLPSLTEKEQDRSVPRMIRRSYFPGFPPVQELPSPDRRWFLLEKDCNLWLRSTFDGRIEPLTEDGTEDRLWRIKQDDMWNAALWSPSGAYLVAIKEDRRGVLRTPIVHWLKPNEEVEWVPRTKAGGPLPQTELYVIDIFSRRRVRIDTGEDPDQYLHNVSWLPDGSELIYLSADRDFKQVQVRAADPVSGESRLILVESQPTFVKDLSINPSWDQLATLLGASRLLVWISERDGWDHLYLYDLAGRLLRRLTSGEFPVTGVSFVDEDAGWVYFTAHAEKRLYDTHLYRVSLDGGDMVRLTDGPGQHQVAFAPSGKYFIDTHSSIDRPTRVELRAADGRLLRVLVTADVSALSELQWSPPEPFVVKAADGLTDLYGLLFKPWDFDPGKSYPVIEKIYAGPFMTWVPHTFAHPRLTEAHALAQLGCVTLMVDARGTPERGKAFQDVVYRSFGRNEIPDHVAVLRQLAAERPYLDISRVGVFGGSWGGYFTVRAMLQAPEIYKVGIATNPLYDLYDHGATGLEGYMGLPQQNMAAYEYASCLRLAGALAGKLLLIHGTADINVTFSTTMKMAEALIRAGKPFDLIVLPDQDHHPTGQSRRYLQEAHRRYFQEHLLTEQRTNCRDNQ